MFFKKFAVVRNVHTQKSLRISWEIFFCFQASSFLRGQSEPTPIFIEFFIEKFFTRISLWNSQRSLPERVGWSKLSERIHTNRTLHRLIKFRSIFSFFTENSLRKILLFTIHQNFQRFLLFSLFRKSGALVKWLNPKKVEFEILITNCVFEQSLTASVNNGTLSNWKSLKLLQVGIPNVRLQRRLNFNCSPEAHLSKCFLFQFETYKSRIGFKWYFPASSSADHGSETRPKFNLTPTKGSSED